MTVPITTQIQTAAPTTMMGKGAPSTLDHPATARPMGRLTATTVTEARQTLWSATTPRTETPNAMRIVEAQQTIQPATAITATIPTSTLRCTAHGAAATALPAPGLVARFALRVAPAAPVVWELGSE